MKDATSRLEQKKVLHRNWKFECEQIDEDVFVFKKTIENVKIVWNIKHQVGAYTIDGENITLLFNWESLVNLMEQILL